MASLVIRRRLISSSPGSSIDPLEIAKFSKAASDWWSPRGDFELLHRMNPLRVSYIRRHLLQSSNGLDNLRHLKLLDVGSGGGLLSESLARLGTTVKGIDASKENIGIATAHAVLDPKLSSLSYECTTAEALVERGESFDVVCSMEVMEHVRDPKSFTASCAQLVKPSGHLFFSTINRTLASYIFTILFAERVLRLVPKGTHDHAKYVTPQELKTYLEDAGCSLKNVSGIGLNPVLKEWFLEEEKIPSCLQSKEPLMNYIVFAQKL